MKKKTSTLSDIFDAPPFLLDPQNQTILERGIRFPKPILLFEAVLSLIPALGGYYLLQFALGGSQNSDLLKAVGLIVGVGIEFFGTTVFLLILIIKKYMRIGIGERQFYFPESFTVPMGISHMVKLKANIIIPSATLTLLSGMNFIRHLESSFLAKIGPLVMITSYPNRERR